MSEAQWYKGNIHTHTTESDGDEDPHKVTSWYRRHGYDFLVLSDHNHLTLLDYSSGRRRFRKPLMVPGEEVSVRIHGGATPVHINGVGISRIVEPIDADDVVSTLQANVDAIIQAGGIASINHPNFQWAFDHHAISQVEGASLLEVFNGHPGANLFGSPDRPSCEEIWDGVLSAGRVIFGVATDDSHNYHDFAPWMSNPGRGWVMVEAEELTQDAIVDGLASGRFYASTGVTLTRLECSAEGISLEIEQDRDLIYATRFTGKDGVLLSEVTGLTAEYETDGHEDYVRATIISSFRTPRLDAAGFPSPVEPRTTDDRLTQTVLMLLWHLCYALHNVGRISLDDFPCTGRSTCEAAKLGLSALHVIARLDDALKQWRAIYFTAVSA